MSDVRVAACLLFGIYDRTPIGMDRRECAACHGDSCPYVLEPTASATCPACFGTGVAMIGTELEMRDGMDAACRRCDGTGKVEM